MYIQRKSSPGASTAVLVRTHLIVKAELAGTKHLLYNCWRENVKNFILEVNLIYFGNGINGQSIQRPIF